jgi:hypothetical protein
MRRAHTTFDLLEGHILTGMLRDSGIEARLFDADFVRQDWFKILAYGGYRVVVRDEDVSDARTLLNQYHEDALALTGEHHSPCPNCLHAAASDDPQPRRNVFLAMLVLPVVEFLAFLHWNFRLSESSFFSPCHSASKQPCHGCSCGISSGACAAPIADIVGANRQRIAMPSLRASLKRAIRLQTDLYAFSIARTCIPTPFLFRQS